MLTEQELIEYIKKIFKKENLGTIISLEKFGIGFSRQVFCINNKYVIKLCLDKNREHNTLNELQFYINNSEKFHPSLIAYDISKEIIPFVYSIEENLIGNNLFEIWEKIDNKQKYSILEYLLIILSKINIPNHGDVNDMQYSPAEQYSINLEKIKKLSLIKHDKIEYLQEIALCVKKLFKDSELVMTHGDIHFNNLIYTKDGLKIIDFENYSVAPLEKEFDSIFRMSRNPNSFIQSTYQKCVNSEDYKIIIPFFEQNYSKIGDKKIFEEKLLVYDMINSMKWLPCYPDYKLYNEVLFQQSGKLLKLEKQV